MTRKWLWVANKWQSENHHSKSIDKHQVSKYPYISMLSFGVNFTFLVLDAIPYKGAIFFLNVQYFFKVQSYLNELWKGGLPWTANTIKVTQSWMPTKMTVSEVLLDVGKSVEMMTSSQVVLVFFAMLICPPIWIFFSLPLDIRLNL